MTSKKKLKKKVKGERPQNSIRTGLEYRLECSYDKLIHIDELHLNPDNPNKHPEKQVTILAQILKDNGVRRPIRVSTRSGLVSAGHCQIMAFKINGWDYVPVDFQDYKNEADEWNDVVADNAISQMSDLDLGKINEVIVNLGPDYDVSKMGLPNFKVEPADKGPADGEDDVPEKVKKRAKCGDLWILGEHRLLCGDATKVKDVNHLMGGAKADMVFTDPPYGIGLDTDWSKMTGPNTKIVRNVNTFDKIKDDDKEYSAEFLLEYFSECSEIFMWGANYYCWSIARKGSWVVWDKRQTEALDRMYGSVFEMCWSKTKHRNEMARITWAGFLGHDKKQDGDRKVHPTQKPIKLAEWFFDKWGKDKTNIVDLYGGSGSTLIACEKTDRKCFMMEIDPHYCDVILQRYEKFSGKKVQKIKGAKKKS